MSVSINHFFVGICLAWSANLCSVKGKTPISSHIFFSLFAYIFFFWAHSLSNNQLPSCIQHRLFRLHSLFCLICCFITTYWVQIRYPMHAGHGTFTTNGSSPVNAVILNSLIWDFFLFEAVFYDFCQPTFLSGHHL